jgi:acetoin utilization deacetylase AcuC-like enzyme
MKKKEKISSTGYVYDPVFLQHTLTDHPENDSRLRAIMGELEESGLNRSLHNSTARSATPEELSLVHRAEYIRLVKEQCRQSRYLDPDTYTNPHTFAAASKAAGGLIDLAKAVLDGALHNGFALIRPPGHHALSDRAMGFCVFNNEAIAVRAVQKQWGRIRVAIIDFDGHHGNGTQAIFDDDPEVLYVSSHSYPHYPGSGAIQDIGRGQGKGLKVNLPLRAHTGDEGFKRIYKDIVAPILRRFRPGLIVVSAGYDAHWADPLLNLDLTSTGQAWLSGFLVNLAGELCAGKIVFSLNGGYNLTALATGVANSFRALLGENNYIDVLGPSPRSETDLPRDYIPTLKQIHGLIDNG